LQQQLAKIEKSMLQRQKKQKNQILSQNKKEEEEEEEKTAIGNYLQQQGLKVSTGRLDFVPTTYMPPCQHVYIYTYLPTPTNLLPRW
jgi:hypothetical protein